MAWIKFEIMQRLGTAKTDRWQVHSTLGGTLLGVVKWFPPWRQYAFFPEPGTLFEQDCLRSIADHCQIETQLVKGRSAAAKLATRKGAA